MESALNQYLRLYDEHRAELDSGSAPVLNARRPQAYEDLVNNYLPAKGSEDYEHTDLQALLSPDYGLNLQRLRLGGDPAQSFRCGVPNMSTLLFLSVDDVPGQGDRVAAGLPAGVTAGSLRTIALENPGLVQRFYATLADMANPLTALNTLLAQDGFFLHVAKGVHLEKPLQLVNIFQAQLPLMSARRLLIVMEEDTEARLLMCDHTQNPDQDYLSLQTVEIFAGRNSRFDFYDLEESSRRTRRLSQLYLRQEEGSNVLVDGITLYNGTTRNEYYCDFQGGHAELQLLGMGIEDERRSLCSHSVVRHNTGHCHTDELFKYVADDQARASFSGRIYVAPGAVKTEAYQSNRNMVGSPEARAYSKPQLEIYNDDVKCSHGTAVGQLDAMQLFYMRTRGLSEQEAKLLLKQAFMADVIEAVRLPMLRDRLHALVVTRFSGKESSCAACADSDSCPKPDLL